MNSILFDLNTAASVNLFVNSIKNTFSKSLYKPFPCTQHPLKAEWWSAWDENGRMASSVVYLNHLSQRPRLADSSAVTNIIFCVPTFYLNNLLLLRTEWRMANVEVTCSCNEDCLHRCLIAYTVPWLAVPVLCRALRLWHKTRRSANGTCIIGFPRARFR